MRMQVLGLERVVDEALLFAAGARQGLQLWPIHDHQLQGQA